MSKFASLSSKDSRVRGKLHAALYHSRKDNREARKFARRELISNSGGPFKSTAGFTPMYNAAISIVGGNLRVTNVGANYGYASIGFPTKIGKRYRVMITTVFHAYTAAYHVGASAAEPGSYSYGANLPPGIPFEFVATDVTGFIACKSIDNLDGQYRDFIKISVKEL